MRLTSREKILLGILLAMVVLYLEYTYILSGQMERMALAQDQHQALQVKLEQLNKAPETEKQLNGQIEKAMAEISTVMDSYFTDTEQEELILLLNDFVANSGVDVSGIRFTAPEEMPVSELTFKKIAMTMDFDSTFESADGLLKKVWNFQKMLVLDGISLSNNDDGTLSGTADLGLYYLAGYEGTGYKDNLYQVITDEAFFKVNPFMQSAGAADYRINYIYTGGKDPGEAAYVPYTDIAGTWAEKEINAFGEKGYLMKGQATTFGPDTPMTRGEFIIMTDRIYQWPIPETPVDLTKFSDYSNLGSYENAIAKAVFKGYLGGFVVGFTDNTLRPRDPMTYEEAEFIMQKIKNDPAFKWDTAAQKLQAEKAVVSVGLTDKKALMSKAEAVYMLTHFK